MDYRVHKALCLVLILNYKLHIVWLIMQGAPQAEDVMLLEREKVRSEDRKEEKSIILGSQRPCLM